MNFNDPKEFDDILVTPDPKGISIGIMDFDNPKVNGDTLISDGLVFASTSLDNISNFLVICYDCPCHKGFTHVDCRAIRPTSPQTTFPQ